MDQSFQYNQANQATQYNQSTQYNQLNQATQYNQSNQPTEYNQPIQPNQLSQPTLQSCKPKKAKGFSSSAPEELKNLFERDMAMPLPQPEVCLNLEPENKSVPDIKSRSSFMNPHERLSGKNFDPNTGAEIIYFSKELETEQEPEPEASRRYAVAQQNIKNAILSGSKNRFRITATAMYCMSFEEQVKKSVVTIRNKALQPGLNESLSDLRLGCVNQGEICYTCKKNNEDCGGHNGIIILRRSYIHPLYKNDTLYCLRSICNYCGHLYINEEYIKAGGISHLTGSKRLKAIAEISDKLHGLHSCPNIDNDYDKDYRNGYIITYKKCNAAGKTFPVERTVSNVEKILSSLYPEEVALLGFEGNSHPKNFIMKGITVPPRQARPTMYAEGMPREDYITQVLLEIINANNLLSRYTIMNENERNEYERNEHEKIKNESNLYELIEALILGSEKRTMNKGEKDVALIPKLGKKDGLLRKNFMGKRVDFSARTVAGPASEANYGEILYPKNFATILTVPEKVTEYNIERLREIFLNGKALGIVPLNKATDHTITINADIRQKHILQKGDIIVRYIQNGDALFIGRQPSLHAESFMGFSARQHDKMTIGLHSSCNAPFNADFDGDELNLHLIQDVKAQAEALTIANVKNHIMNVQSNKPMMGLAYNGILSAYIMTMTWILNDVSEISISKEQWDSFGFNKTLSKQQWVTFLEIIRGKESYREVVIPDKRWNEMLGVINNSDRKSTLEDRCLKHGLDPKSGRALFSLAFPTNFSFVRSKKSSKKINFTTGESITIDVEEGINIKDGILIAGTLSDATVGRKTNSLVQILAKIYSNKEASRFINDGQKICDTFLMWHGFSIGYEAIDGDRKRILGLIKEEVNKTQFEIYNLGPMPKESIPLFFWKKKAINYLSNTEQIGANIGEKILTPNNQLNVMGDVGSGEKGSKKNTAQITGSLGAQFIKGDLQPLEFNNGTRYLPTFLPNDVSIASKAYVIHSFLDGLNASEEFAHASAGREGLVDTANNTSDIGYSSRRIRKTLEDTSIDYLGRVSTVNDRIFSFSFGDCLNPAYQTPTKNKERGDVVNFCDVSNIIRMLNDEYENENPL